MTNVKHLVLNLLLISQARAGERHCETQLPAETTEEFQRSVDWSAPDHADRANRLAQRMVLDALQRYQGFSGPSLPISVIIVG